MASSGSESFTSISVDHELVPGGPEEEMATRLVLRRSREVAARRQRSDSQRRKSIAFVQPVVGSGVAASQEAVRSIWRLNIVAEAQPLCWHIEHEAWPTSDDVMARRAYQARERARDARRPSRRRSLERESHTLWRPIGCTIAVDATTSCWTSSPSRKDSSSTGTVLVTGSEQEE
ncbi:ATP-dependent DNA helicase Q4 [Hordeum vulgare]|nr:ATP-dependent DNA helicase Q4 [Hordeum vulgare]